MRLVVPGPIADRLREAVRSAGKREIGGILMGEHLGDDLFKVLEITVQARGGTFATFVRLVEGVLAPLRRFFKDTAHEYTRFNYLGEWHSHHSFALRPSSSDDTSMIDIVADPGVGARFATLLIIRLTPGDELEAGLFVYLPSGIRFPGQVLSEVPESLSPM